MLAWGKSSHEHQITFVDFSPDGRFLVTASDQEETSKLWNTATGQIITELNGTTDLKAFRLVITPDAHVFSPDSRILVTVRGRKIKLRDAANGPADARDRVCGKENHPLPHGGADLMGPIAGTSAELAT
jgi:WD40 repeat protein